MTTFKAHFGGYVKDMDADTASIEIDNVSTKCGVSKGDLVKAARASFMPQPPMPSVGSYVEGNVVENANGQTEFINIVRPV